MTSIKELRITIDEIAKIAWKCSACNAEQSMDILISHQQADTMQYADYLLKCGVCNKPHDSALLQALKSLSTFYREVHKSKLEVFFRIPLKNEKESQQ